MTLPVLYLSGTPYAQGLQHGEVLREQIGHNLAVYFERFEREVNLKRSEVLARAAQYAAAIVRQNGAYYHGMRGIAESSGFDLAEVVALNVCDELFYHQFGAKARGDGCTVFAVLPNVSAEHHLLIGENWDWISNVRGAVVHTTEAEGLKTLSFTEAGIFGGKIGLNSAGLGLAINGLVTTDDDWSRLSKPFHVRCYEILRACTFEAAVRVVTGSDRACSANFLIAEVPDRVVNIEAAPHTIGLIGCEHGCLVHSNHFINPAALGVVEPPIEKSPHSYSRHERLYQLLLAQRPLTVEAIQSALRDHEGYPYSICFHIDPAEPPEEHYLSLVSAIIDLHAGTLWISDGPPCENPYQRIMLEG